MVLRTQWSRLFRGRRDLVAHCGKRRALSPGAVPSALILQAGPGASPACRRAVVNRAAAQHRAQSGADRRTPRPTGLHGASVVQDDPGAPEDACTIRTQHLGTVRLLWHWQPAWSAACAMSACQPLPTKPSPPRRAASFPREPSYSYHEASTSQRRGGESNPSEKPLKTQAAPHGAAHNPAQPPPSDLAEVVSAWPSLPPDAKRRILALVRSIRPVLQVPRNGNNDICITISAKPLTQPRMRNVTPCDYWSFPRFDQGAQGSRGDSGRRLVRFERSMGARGGRA